MWFATLLQIIESALAIWASKEKRKYIDEKLAIQKAYYEEQNKPAELRSDAVLDNWEFKLRVLSSALAADMLLPPSARIT